MRKIGLSPMILLGARGKINQKPFRFRGDFFWADKDTGKKNHSVVTIGMDEENEVLAKKRLEEQFLKHFGTRVSDRGFAILTNRIKAHGRDVCQMPRVKPKLSQHESGNPS